MATILVRNIPKAAHAKLRELATSKRISVEALARNVLEAAVRQPVAGGIDFARLAIDRAALGLIEDGPDWSDSADESALSRRVLGLEM